jgi:hypothetical protein
LRKAIGTSTFLFSIATKEKYAHKPNPIGITDPRRNEYGLNAELIKRYEPPPIDTEARNNPKVDTKMPTTAKDLCLTDSFGFSKINIIVKKMADANETNEKTTTIRFETKRWRTVNAAIPDEIPERNASKENNTLFLVAKMRITPQETAVT